MRCGFLILFLMCLIASETSAQVSLLRAGQNVGGGLVSINGSPWLIAIGELELSFRPLTLTTVDDDEEIPAVFAVHSNYPNPFNPVTTLVFDLDESAEVRVEIFDLTGRLMQVVSVGRKAAGAQRTLKVAMVDLASGTYFYRVIARGASGVKVGTGRMVLVK